MPDKKLRAKLENFLRNAQTEQASATITIILLSVFLFSFTIPLLSSLFSFSFFPFLPLLLVFIFLFFPFRSLCKKKSLAKKMYQLLESALSGKEGSLSFQTLGALWKTDLTGVRKTLSVLCQKKRNVMKLFSVLPDNSGLCFADGSVPVTPVSKVRNAAELEAAPHLAFMKNLLATLPKNATAYTKVSRLRQDTEKLLFAANRPGEIAGAASFLHIFLPMGTKLLGQYTTLPEENKPLEEKILHGLDTLHGAFLKKQEEYMEDSRADMQAELTVLTQMLQQNGLADSEFDLSIPAEGTEETPKNG